MHQIRHILQMRAKGISLRRIALSTGLSRPTVSQYLSRWESSGLKWEQLTTLDDAALGSLLYQEPKPLVDRQRQEDLEARIPTILKDLPKAGVTRHTLWQEYRQQHPDGYGYTQFCAYVKNGAQQSKAVMHFEHKAGACMMIDFAGKKLYYVDPESGEQIACEVLVVVLPCSGYGYVEAVLSQKLEDFLGAIANAFAFLGGVPASGLIDNLRSGVVKPDRYEPTFTELLEQLSAHYDCTFMATRVAKPRDKASVERHVQIVYQRIYAPLRNETFTSLEALNRAILERLSIHHELPFQQNQHECRRSVFESSERPALRPLPPSAFEVKHSTRYKVQRNYHLQLGCDRHYYSVPHEHIGKTVQVVYTRKTVEIYDGHQRIAFHQRDRRANAYTTVAEHMPPNHLYYSREKAYSAQYFLEKTARIGQSCHDVCTRILDARIFEQQSYLSCLGLLRLADKYSAERLERACSRALRAEKPTYGMVGNILKNNLDQLEVQPDPNILFSQTPAQHQNLRGPDAFQ